MARRFWWCTSGFGRRFLKANYVPYLKDAMLLALLGGVITMAAAAVLASVALRPIEEISRRLESLGAGEPVVEGQGRGGARG